METTSKHQEGNSPIKPASTDLTVIPIANLNPSTPPPPNSEIRARVALVYPYSSSTESAGILAADPDFRARRNGGQIHVQLKGRAAKSVGASGIGIGDLIHLSLGGATWVEDNNAARTPGKSVKGALLYQSRLDVKIWKDGSDVLSFSVDEPDSSRVEKTPPASPRKTADSINPSLVIGSDPFSSPVFLRTKRWTQPSLVGPLKPASCTFVDDALDFDNRPRKRTKFWRASGEWRYDQKSPTPPPGEEEESRPSSPLIDAADGVHPSIVTIEAVQQHDPSPTDVSNGNRTQSKGGDDEVLPKLTPMDMPNVGVELQSHITPMTPASRTNGYQATDLLSSAGIDSATESPVTAIVDNPPTVESSLPRPQDGVPESSESSKISSATDILPSDASIKEDEDPSNLPMSLPSIDTSLGVLGAADVSSITQSPLTPQSPRLRPQELDALQLFSPFSGIGQSPSIRQSLSIHEDFTTVSSQRFSVRSTYEGMDSENAVQLTHSRSVTDYVPGFGTDGASDVRPSTLENLVMSGFEFAWSNDYPDLGVDGTSSSRPTRPPGIGEDNVMQVDVHDSEVNESGAGEDDGGDTTHAGNNVRQSEGLVSSPVFSGNSPTSLETPGFSPSKWSGGGDHARSEDAPRQSPVSYQQEQIEPLSRHSVKEDTSLATLHVEFQQESVHAPQSPLSDYRDERRSTLDFVDASLRSGPLAPRTSTPSQPSPSDAEVFNSNQQLFDEMVDTEKDPGTPVIMASIAETRPASSPYMNSQQSDAHTEPIVRNKEFLRSEEQDNHAISMLGVTIDPLLLLPNFLEGQVLPATEPPLAVRTDEVVAQGSTYIEPAPLSSEPIQKSREDFQTERKNDRVEDIVTKYGIAADRVRQEESTGNEMAVENVVVVVDDGVADDAAVAEKTMGSGPAAYKTDQQDIIMTEAVRGDAIVEEDIEPNAITKYHRVRSRSPDQSNNLESDSLRKTEDDLSSFQPPAAQGSTIITSEAKPEALVESTSSEKNTTKPTEHRVPDASSPWFSTAAETSLTNEYSLGTEQDQNLPALQTAALESSEPKTAVAISRLRRRSARLRKSNVPDILSEWFEARDDGEVEVQEAQEAQGHAADQGTKAITSKRQSKEIAFHETRQATPPTLINPFSTGRVVVGTKLDRKKDELDADAPCNFRTSLSYYHALQDLTQFLNSPNSSLDNAVDIMAVVTWQSKKPKKSKGGPKDQYTILHVAQPPKAEESTEVHVFRPNKDVLPVADKGDVILLRNFAVKSRHRECYLLSADSSAWHVWHFHKASEIAKQSEKPVWAKGKKGNDVSVVEESRGAPVEIGEDEQTYAQKLRSWWDELQSQKLKSGEVVLPHDEDPIEA